MAKLEPFPIVRKDAQPGFIAKEIDILNIVIIDDNEMTRAVLRSILTQDGYKVIGEASTGKSGLEQVGKVNPHIVCLDIVMPDLSGIDVLKQIVEQYPKVIVLMVTGKRDIGTVKECLAGGAKGFIVKPFNAATVLNVVRDAVMRSTEAGQPR